MCRFGTRCKYEHVGPGGNANQPGGNANQPLTGVCAACSSKSHGISQCPVHARQQQRKAGNARALEAKAAKEQLEAITTELASMKAMFAHHPAPAAVPTSFAHHAQTAPTPPADHHLLEVQRLQGQLAAALSSNPYYSFAGGHAAGP